MNPAEQIPPPAYFGSLTIENVKCFKGKHEIDLSDGNGKPAMWTVILGNNNTGKTTLLRCLANLSPISTDLSRFMMRADKDILIPKGNQIRWLSPSIINNDEHKVISSILLNINGRYKKYNDNWQYANTHVLGSAKFSYLGNLIIYAYGTSRRMAFTSLSENEYQDSSETLFEDTVTLINVEEFILQTDYASNKIESAAVRLEKIKQILTNGLLPDVKDIHCRSIEENNQIKNFVEFETDYGFVKLRELGYGYQVTLAWVVDLAKKLFERYPNSENPLHEPAIVLVDEIDLHLHPEWQRKIIKFLSDQFPKTQFIVTTHSPLIIQSMDDINLVLLEKEDDHVIIKQPDLKTYKGWTVEEILSDLMGLDGRTKSEDYYKLIADFNKAALKDDYDTAKKVYDELDGLLNKNNPYRELLDLQLSRLSIPESA